MKVFPQYYPEEIVFRNGAVLKFRGQRAQFAYNPSQNTLAILNYATPRAAVKAIQEQTAGTEVRRIRYRIYFFRGPGSTKTITPYNVYTHAVPPGTFLNFSPGGDSRAVFLRRANGRPFFFNGRTVYDVTQGKIDSDDPAWQFLES